MADQDLPVLDHLAELRKRIIIVLVAVAMVMVVFYSRFHLLVEFLLEPVSRFKLDIAFFSLTEGFTTRLKLSTIASIIVNSPLILFQAAAFINPGMTKREKKILYSAVVSISLFFIGGALFGYFVLFPNVIYFLISYSQSYMMATLSGDRYFSFIGVFCLIMGGIFVIPLVLVFLGKLEMLSYRILKKSRLPVFFAVLAVVGTVMPVLDFFTLGLTAAPILLLLEISIWVVFFMERGRKKALEEGKYNAPGEG